MLGVSAIRSWKVKFFVFVKVVWGSGVEVGATGMVSWLRVHTALAEDLSSIPSAHTGKLTTACNSLDLNT